MKQYARFTVEIAEGKDPLDLAVEIRAIVTKTGGRICNWGIKEDGQGSYDVYERRKS